MAASGPASRDALLAPYRDLRGRAARREPFAEAICEGAYLVDLVLTEARNGRLAVPSVVVAADHAAAWTRRLPAHTRMLALDPEELHALVGFAFHRGVLAAVLPPPEPDLQALRACARLLVLPRLDQEENLGLLLRSAAALGMDGVLLGGGVSPWARRTVRTSMGGVFRLPIWRRADPSELLATWRGDAGEVVAAALGGGACDAGRWMPAARTALLLGPEDRGLDRAWMAGADRAVTIPMSRGMDSLNVAAAGAILMARLCGAL